ncbi:MAG: hypothetical protein R3222_09880, partial [Balneolaceae bacterium]|nr:hypothetical protein [Balneolaceae bacterium]
MILIIIGCSGQEQKANRDAAAREQLPTVRQQGMEISKQAFQTLSRNLKQAMSEGGIPYAL